MLNRIQHLTDRQLQMACRFRRRIVASATTYRFLNDYSTLRLRRLTWQTNAYRSCLVMSNAGIQTAKRVGTFRNSWRCSYPLGCHRVCKKNNQRRLNMHRHSPTRSPTLHQQTHITDPKSLANKRYLFYRPFGFLYNRRVILLTKCHYV